LDDINVFCSGFSDSIHFMGMNFNLHTTILQWICQMSLKLIASGIRINSGVFILQNISILLPHFKLEKHQNLSIL